MNDQLQTASDIVRDPSSAPWTTYIWVVVLAVWGGIVRVIREVKLGGKTIWQILLTFLAECTVSSFAGVMTCLMVESSSLPRAYVYALGGLAGYMGGRALNLLESIVKARSFKGE